METQYHPTYPPTGFNIQKYKTPFNLILYQVKNYFLYVHVEHMHTLPDLIASICTTNTAGMRLLLYYVK